MKRALTLVLRIAPSPVPAPGIAPPIALATVPGTAVATVPGMALATVPGTAVATVLSMALAIALGMALALAPKSARAEDDPLRDARLLRFPDLHGDRIAFVYAGDIWTASASGGEARRLTTGDGLELFPRFSPDGAWIAFTGHDDGTSDVYVMPSSGGVPRRLTWYPSAVNRDRMGWDNMVLGWTPEGRILLRSQRGPIGGFVGEPWTVAPEGGPVLRFPLPESGLIAFSPDGKKVAYNRIFRNFRTWKRYRGGMAQDVWIHDLEARSTERLTDWEGTDTHPMWIEGAVYFVSDREAGRLNIWRHDLETGDVVRITDFRDHDVGWARSDARRPPAGPGRIVFEQAGAIHLLDAATGESRRLTIRIGDDRRHARKRWERVEGSVTEYSLAPGGARALVVARGDVFTVPAEKGDVRHIAATPASRERAASWSPDGRWIACISDATGEDEIVLVPERGGSPVRLTSGPPKWRFAPVWSPDSRKLAWGDRGMRLWTIDIEEKKPIPVDESSIWEITDYAWSPDSRWIAYAKAQENGLPAVHIHALDTRTTTRVTGEAFASFDPAFDPSGSYLYFLSDRDIHPTLGSFELSFTANRMTRPYVLCLRAEGPSPMDPGSDEAAAGRQGGPAGGQSGGAAGGGAGGQSGGAAAPAGPFRIDLDTIEERAVALAVPPGEYGGLRAAPGRIFFLSSPLLGMGEDPAGSETVLRTYDLAARKAEDVVSPVDGYDLSPCGTRVIYRRGGATAIVDAKPGGGNEKRLDLSGLELRLDPPAEWAQIFQEVWRLSRDYFYLPDMGRIDWEGVRARYEPLLPHVSHRYDLTFILGEMVGELGTGHTYVGGGDYPTPPRVAVGLLGAELALDGDAGAWRIERIFRGQRWAPGRGSPLLAPGVDVAEGEYLLAIDGRDLTAGDEPYAFLVQKAGRSVELLVGPRPDRASARRVTVRPIASEADLRYEDWVERNRLAVDRATGGRAGYVHIPDMQARGLREFIRQYYPQIRKEGLIVDVRFNGGGFVSQIILERLRRILVGMSAPRDARPTTVPRGVFHGPMVALINQYSASDGDLFPHYFRKYRLGPLIGRRTWGGVVGIRGGGGLVDGGYVNVPEFGNYGAEGAWILENEGAAPDIEVDNLPGDELAGRDAQLERGIEEVLRRIGPRPRELPPRPPSKDLRPPGPPGEEGGGEEGERPERL